MEMSDMFFLPDLKRQVGSYFTKFIAIDNVVDLLQTARLFNVPKLEHQCIEFMANYIEEVILRTYILRIFTFELLSLLLIIGLTKITAIIFKYQYFLFIDY